MNFNLKIFFIIINLSLIIARPMSCRADDMTMAIMPESDNIEVVAADVADSLSVDTMALTLDAQPIHKTIYSYPYSLTLRDPDWHRMWINTATLAGAFVASLVGLECLPEDATSWNRAEIQEVPLFKRWFRNIFKRGPEWDHDKFYFNYILHPYAGAAYFMGARSCGFNFYQSLLYCTCVSTIGWEFGIEAFMERPSIQDLFITPLVGSAIGEGFYKLKRNIVRNGYSLFGSKAVGNIVVFIIDPVNEVIGLFAGNDARKYASTSLTARSLTVSITI
jgi:hypothetical protein